MYSLVRQNPSLRISTILTMACLFCAPSIVGQTGGAASASAPTSSWKQVEDAMGRPGQTQPADVIKFGMPRKDLHVVLDGVDIKAGLALGSWVAFKREESGAMVMGDLVLTEDEVEPVMLKLLTRARLARSIRIINGLVAGNLSRALAGESVGTLIHS